MIITGNSAAIAGAYIAARAEINTRIRKTGQGVYGKYPTLNSVIDAITDVLATHKIVILQEPLTTETGVAVATSLLHESGATIEFGPLTMPLADRKPQAVGSAVTYARRYALVSIFGLMAVDDDGQAAEDSFKAKTPQPATNGYQDDALWDKPASHDKKPDTLSPEQLDRLTRLVADFYGAEAKEQQVKLSQAVSKGAVSQFKELTPKEAQVLIGGIEKKQQEVQNGKIAV